MEGGGQKPHQSSARHGSLLEERSLAAESKGPAALTFVADCHPSTITNDGNAVMAVHVCLGLGGRNDGQAQDRPPRRQLSARAFEATLRNCTLPSHLDKGTQAHEAMKAAESRSKPYLTGAG